MLIVGTLFLAAYTSMYTWKFLKQDGLHHKPLVLARGLWKLLGRNGLVSRTIPYYLEFFSKDFHPWQQENSHLIRKWRSALEALQTAA